MTSEPSQPRRWIQFRLRTLLLFMLLASAGVSCFCAWWRPVAERRQAAQDVLDTAFWIKKVGGRVQWLENPGDAPAGGPDHFPHPVLHLS